MRRMIGIALVATAVALGGCLANMRPTEPMTPEQAAQMEVRSAREVVIAATFALVLAKDAGHIGQEEWDGVYLPLIERADTVFRRLADSPDATLADALREEASVLAIELARAQREVERADGG